MSDISKSEDANGVAAEAHGSARHYTTHPECPYCGHIERDDWEIDFGGIEGDAELTCGKCERDYLCSRSVNVSYSTHPLPNNVIGESHEIRHGNQP